MIAADLLDRGNRLVAKEAVGIVECGNQRVHRALCAELGQRRRNMTTDPDVLALIAKRVRQCPDDRFAVAHERLACRGFQRAVTEQREQSGNEQAIRGAHFARAANRFLYDEGIMVVEQRHE